MKKCLILMLTATMLFSLLGCRQTDPISTSTSTRETQTMPADSAYTVPVSEPEDGFSYSRLQYTDFLFSSGTGAWGTSLYVAPDGTFTGVYHDSEMGDTGEGYAHGTVYYCDFYGQFGKPVKIDEYTYSLPLQVLRYGHVPDSQEIIDQQRYCYTTAIGIEGTQSLLLYLPDSPVDALPMEYRQWVGLHNNDTAILPFWGLYNENQQCGFSSTDRIQSARETVQTAEEVELSINGLLDAYSTQADMNIAAQQRYIVWDDALNSLWRVLKQVLGEDAMTRLTNDQLIWIREKENAASDAAAEFEGGSLYPCVFYTVAADLTKERVYYLLSFLP